MTLIRDLQPTRGWRAARSPRGLRLSLALWVLAGSFSAVQAADSVDYLRQVKPILRQRCYACHGALRHRARLRLDTGAAIRRGGAGGPAVEAGDAEASLLIERVGADDAKLRMPPEGPALSPPQLAVLRAWIDQGAQSPAGERPEDDPRDHWAFRPVAGPPAPAAADLAWARNPIDAFLAAEHARRGLRPLPQARPEVLLRRLYLDLVGLPPTREQLHAFLADPSDAAYVRIVDRLLSSPQHGERWARHWMDVWRYSDWYGRRAVPDVLNSYAMIWRWRDWIVRSLNRDSGYDEMVRQMLSADELNPTDDANLVATGYVVRNFYRWNYNSWLKDNVEHTARAFLGLTIQCAHCHDHKYDPIRQEEYFALRACFEPIEIRHDRVPGEPDPGPYPKYVYGAAYAPITSGMVRVFDERLDARTFLYTRGESRNVVPGRPPIAPGVPAFLKPSNFRVEPVALPPEASYPGLKDFIRREETERRLAELARVERGGGMPEAERFAARAEFVAVRARIEADRVRFGREPGDAEASAKAAARAERLAAWAQASLARRRAEQKNDPKDLAAARAARETALAAWKKPPGAYTPLSPVYPARSTGRRAALARWITAPENPLTARVAVNHLWRWHFHQPLVASTADFGRNGKRPTHPALLDWLASEFMARGWSMKHLHRLIVTSEVYRMGSHPDRPDDPNRRRDPENVALWRFPTGRLEAEAVRDSLLASAGTLDPALGGPDIDFNQGFASRRRSLYLTHHGEGRMPFLELFDAPDVCEAYTRTVSVVPQQSLALANNELARALSASIAGRLWGDVSHEQGSSALGFIPPCKGETQGGSGGMSLAAASSAPPPLPPLCKGGSSSTTVPSGRGDQRAIAFVIAAFEQVLCRRPTAAEQERSLTFLQRQKRLFAGSRPADSAEADRHAARARGNLVQVLFNHNDFLTIH
jgi:hypothetical protein